MKTKIRLTETNLISLIKRILLEQTPEELAAQYGRQTNLEMLPNYASGEQTVTQPLAAQQQPLAAAQQPAQRQVARTSGYIQKDKGPYKLGDKAVAIRKLQEKLNITPDGKFGPRTLQHIRKMLQDSKKTQITDEEINNYKKQSTPDAATAQAQQPMQNNLGIILNIETDYGGDINYINKSFMKGGYIQLTDSDGRTKVTTSCESLKTKKGIRYVVKGDGYNKESITIPDKLYNILNYNFCSKNVTNVNVTNIVVRELKALPADSNRFVGQFFRGVKDYATKSIYIKNEKGGTILHTNCNDLGKNIFYRNYSALNFPKGSTVALTKLSAAIKPSFCTSNTKA